MTDRYEGPPGLGGLMGLLRRIQRTSQPADTKPGLHHSPDHPSRKHDIVPPEPLVPVPIAHAAAGAMRRRERRPAAVAAAKAERRERRNPQWYG